MPRAVQLSAYGDVDQLQIVERDVPSYAANEVLVRVVAAGTNPGEIAIRSGALKDRFPKAFPFGQGSDFAGRIAALGPDVSGFAVGDEILGWTDDRAAQADYVVASSQQIVAKPPALDWYRAGSLFVAATTAVAAVRAVGLKPGDTVAVSAGAGGVGSLAVQLARRAGARVIGVSGDESDAFLKSVGVERVAYGDGLVQRLRDAAPNGIDAFIDLFGSGYVDAAIELGIAPSRINTIIDFAAVEKHAVKNAGSYEAADRETLAGMANLIAWGAIVMPLAAIYPFDLVRDAYVELAKRKSKGKIVLAIDPTVQAPLYPGPLPAGRQQESIKG